MARPRKDAAEPSVEQRLEDAFWELIAEMPIDRMTVGGLTARAGCNRGTFYYYYDDIYAMLDDVIDRNLPKELPQFLLMHFSGDMTTTDRDYELSCVLQKYQRNVDHLCLLLANASSPLVNRRVKSAIMELWAGALAVGEYTSLEGDARIVLEFVVSGILGLMAYRAETGMCVSIEEIAQALSPELPDAVAPKLRKLLLKSEH